MTHYFEGRSGDSFVDATIHTDEDCGGLDEPVRPLADSSVPDDADLCDCDSVGNDSDATGGDGEGKPASVEYQIENGVCPWCDDYEGDGVPQHASSAHPDSWAAYSD